MVQFCRDGAVLNTPKHSITVTRGPLNDMERMVVQQYPGGIAFERMCDLGRGAHRVTTHRFRYLTYSGGRTDVTDMVWKLLQWQKVVPFFAYVDARRYGTLDRERAIVQVEHLDDFSTLDRAQQPDVEITANVLDRFLFEFKQVMEKRANIDWDATGKERSLSKRIINMAGGLDAALTYIKSYYLMPPEHRGDVLSFAAFYASIPRINALREMHAREELGMQQAQARAVTRGRVPSMVEIEETVRRAKEEAEESSKRPSAPRRSRFAEDD